MTLSCCQFINYISSSVPTIYVQIQFPFTNSFSRIVFMDSLSQIFFYKFNITNSFSRINLRIRKYSKKFVQIRTTSFWFVFAKSVLCCERPVLYTGYFALERGTREGDPSSVYLFILAVEVPLIRVKDSELV